MIKVKSLTLFCIISLLFLNVSLAQNKSTEDLYNWFDTTIGKENLAINNGTIHLNYDATLDGKHRYFDSNKFVLGSLNYQGQKYDKVALKYDICNDVLVLKPAIESEYVSINLIQEKINSFVIYNKKFVKLKDTTSASFRDGFYEEKSIGNQFILYIKYVKSKSKVTTGEFVQLDYNLNTTFLLKKENTWATIDSKRSIEKLFPNLKSKINDFYTANHILEKNSKPIFIENLMVYIHNLERY